MGGSEVEFYLGAMFAGGTEESFLRERPSLERGPAADSVRVDLGKSAQFIRLGEVQGGDEKAALLAGVHSTHPHGMKGFSRKSNRA